MAKESPTPVSFRLSPDDRRLIETVAAYQNMTVSDFLRTVVLDAADHIVRTEGRDKILRVLEDSASRLSDEKKALYQSAVGEVVSRRS